MSNRHRGTHRGSARAAARSGLLPLAYAILVVLLASLLFWHLGASSNSVALGSGASGSGTPPFGKGPANYTKQRATCGNVGLPACPTPNPDWISVTGNTASAAASALSRSDIFAGLNAIHQGTTLDLPVLVHPLDANTGSDYYDDEHWVVSIRNAAGVEVGIYDYVFDAAHLRIRFASYAVITPQDPRYGHVYPNITATSAVEDLSRRRGIGLGAGVQPELVFFQLPDSWQGPLAKHQWVAGGQSPIDPLWRIIGTDGKEYFVGEDNNVYSRSQLPLS